MIEGIVKLIGIFLLICLMLWAGYKLEKRQSRND